MAAEQTVEPGKVSWGARFLFGLLAVAAVVLGVIGFHQYLPGHPEYGNGFLDQVYDSLALFVFAAAPLQNSHRLPVVLQIARFAAPAVTVYLIILATNALLLARLQQARIAMFRRHSILCGPPELTRPLAAQIREAGGQAVLISSETARRGGVLQISGDPRQRSVLIRAGLRHAHEVITVGLDSVRNAEVAIAVDAFNRTERTSVVCYAEAQDRELFEAVVRQEAGSDGRRVDVFSRYDHMARSLLDRLPPFPPADPRSAVLVIGYTGLGRMLVDRLMRFWADIAEADPIRPSLAVLGPDLQVAGVEARHADPRRRIAVTALVADSAWLTSVEDLKVPAAGGPSRIASRIPGRVYVCLDDDAAGIAVGNTIVRLLAGHDVTVVVAVGRSNVLGAVAQRDTDTTAELPAVREFQRARLVLVNLPRTVYSIAAIRTGTNETIAKAIHANYLARQQAGGATSDSNPSSVVPWERLGPDLQDSNREQAWDIGHKLEVIGYSAVPATGVITPVPLGEDDVTRLAQVEHRRWMDERTAKGWTYGPQRDDKLKTHPDLREWDDLTEATQEKNLDAVREIPGYLAAAGLTMVRTKP